ncbi:MAG: hypothetical protein NC200_03930 [Candidatus Gastranaerophilales bacterium]|nr:hypothetical protein [Candidatus Gastranaerophilales bacterium]
MKEILLNTSRRLSTLINGNNNFITILLVLDLLISFLWPLYLHLEECDLQYHLYMNTKSSLEDIHNVNLDRYDGHKAHKLTTEEELIRRNNRRFHVRFLFK